MRACTERAADMCFCCCAPAAVENEVVVRVLGVEEARHLLDWIAEDGRRARGREGHCNDAVYSNKGKKRGLWKEGGWGVKWGGSKWG